MLQQLSLPCETVRELLVPDGLPVLYHALYRLSEVKLGDCHCVLAEDAERMRLTPAAIRRHVQELQHYFKMPVVYVGGAGVAHLGRRLQAGGVPYIIPGLRVYLPFLGVFEITRETRKEFKHRLSIFAQLAVLAVLHKRIAVTCESAAELAEVVGCSRSAVVLVFQELEFHGLGYRKREGRNIRFCFAESGRALWEHALPLMVNPCVRVVGVDAIPSGAVITGVDAIAPLTNLACKPVTNYAISRRDFLKSREVEVLPQQVAAYSLELWYYAPNILVPTDVLSVVLSLRKSDDERVQEALETLIQNFPW
ncbi:MAG: hypothetical protein II295_09080 [Akkermansia sp.]|nr:hypothetical protein [Akkermansia sp.]